MPAADPALEAAARAGLCSSSELNRLAGRPRGVSFGGAPATAPGVLKALRRPSRDSAATKIQAIWRSKQSRKRVRNDFGLRRPSKALMRRQKTLSDKDSAWLAQRKSALSDLTEVGAMKQAIAQASSSRWVIDPNNTNWCHWWDLFMMVLLFVVLFLTPYEVAFLEAPSGWENTLTDGLFWVNRAFDAAFLADLIINFFLAYQNPPSKGNTWVRSLAMIRRRYLAGWFVIDLLSVLPFWLVGLLLPSSGGDNPADESARRLLFVVRAVRLLRLLKLSKVLGMSRILKRYETRVELKYNTMSFVKMIAVVVAWSHLQACLWGLIPLFEPADAETWLGDLAASQGVDAEELEPWLKYTSALYFSVMTLTSIGYGAMLPPASNSSEMFLCVVLMMVSSMIWVYTMGQMCAIATSMDPDTTAFHNNMDALNAFMRERGLQTDLRVRCRTFFHATRKMATLTDDSELLEKMSPLLRGTVALETHRSWLSRVWYFADFVNRHATANGLEENMGQEFSELRFEQDSFVSQLAMRLQPMAFTQRERVPPGALYILRKGMVVRGWYFLGPGRVWGQDMIVHHPELIDSTPVVSLTYIEVLCLERDDLFECTAGHPTAQERVKKAARRIALARLLTKHVRRVKAAQKAAGTSMTNVKIKPLKSATPDRRASLTMGRVIRRNSWKSSSPTPGEKEKGGGDHDAVPVRDAVRSELKEQLGVAVEAAVQQAVLAVLAHQRKAPPTPPQQRLPPPTPPQQSRSDSWWKRSADQLSA